MEEQVFPDQWRPSAGMPALRIMARPDVLAEEALGALTMGADALTNGASALTNGATTRLAEEALEALTNGANVFTNGATALTLGATEAVGWLASGLVEGGKIPSDSVSDMSTEDAISSSMSSLHSEEGFEFTPLLQARASEIALLPSGALQLPVLAPEAKVNRDELPDAKFARWMDGGDGITAQLPAQSFFVDYDDTDMSITAFGKTYGPQRKPGDPYTMRPYLCVFERKVGTWDREDFLANFEVRSWDFELAYVTSERLDVRVGLGTKFLGQGGEGELRYELTWMQTLSFEVVVPSSGGTLLVSNFSGHKLERPVPLFRLRSGWDFMRSQWYLAPLCPSGYDNPEPAFYRVGVWNSARMIGAYLQR